MAESIAKKGWNWKWDDSKWIMTLLVIIIGALASEKSDLGHMKESQASLNAQFQIVHTQYVPGTLFFDAIDLLRNENKEYISMIKGDTSGISLARVKYNILWNAIRRDQMSVRGSYNEVTGTN